MIEYNGSTLMSVNDVAQYLNCSYSSAKQSMLRFGEVLENMKCDHCGCSLRSVYVEESAYKEWASVHPNTVRPYSRPVECIETGEIFASATIAAESVGLKKSSLYVLLSQKNSKATFGGKHWRYADDALDKSGEKDG